MQSLPLHTQLLMSMGLGNRKMMTREEYLEYIFEQQLDTLKKKHKSAELGAVVMFHGFYGIAKWVKRETGWEREVQPQSSE